MIQNRVQKLGFNGFEVNKVFRALESGRYPLPKPQSEGGGSNEKQTVTNPDNPPRPQGGKPEEVKGLSLTLEGDKSKQKDAAVVFTIGSLRIVLDLKPLYDAYLYWDQIVVENGIQDGNFCEGIKDCVKTCWEMLNHKRAEEQGMGILNQSIRLQQEEPSGRVGSTAEGSSQT